jgi:hypothetical protein
MPSTPSISTTPLSGGKILVTPLNFTILPTSVISLFVNDVNISLSDASTAIKILSISPINPDTEQIIETIVLDSTMLVLGRTYFISLVVDDVSSAVVQQKCIDLPTTPVITPIARDGSLAFSASNYYNKKNSAIEGFSPITKIEVAISEGTNFNVYRFDPISPDEIYTSIVQMKDNSNNVLVLNNGTNYEFVVRIKNDLGWSLPSIGHIASPQDFPNSSAAVLAVPEGVWKQYNSDTSSIGANNYVFFKRSSDFATLNQKDTNPNSPTYGKNLGPLRITSSTIRRYKLFANMVPVMDTVNPTVQQVINGVLQFIQDSNNPWLDFNPVTNATETVDFTINHPDMDANDPNLVSNNIDTMVYDYLYIDTTPVLGERYKYTVFSKNVNGNGVESNKSNIVLSSKLLEAPTVSSNVNSDGTKTLTVTLVSSGNEHGLVVSKTTPFTYKQKQDSGSYGSDTMFNFDTRATINDPNSTTTPPATIANPAFNTYVFQASANGVNLTVDIRKIGVNDSVLPSVFTQAHKTFYSSVTRVTDLIFSNPSAPSAVAVYAIDNNFEPIKVNGQAGVQAVFKPYVVNKTNSSLNDSALGGLQKHPLFSPSNDLKYHLYTNSVLNSSVLPIFSEDIVPANAEYQFFVQSPLGTLPNHYIRTFIRNPSTGVWYTSIDSTPPQSGNSVDHPAAVTGLAITRNSSTSVNVTFNPNSTSAGLVSGSTTNNIEYRIDVLDMATNTIIFNTLRTWAEISQSSNPIVVTGLTQGKGYLVNVISQINYIALKLGVASNTTPDANNTRFFQAKVRRNFSTLSFVAAAAPSVPTGLSVAAMDSQLYVQWNTPSQLNGTVLSQIKLYAAREATETVVDSLLNPAFPLKQKPILSVSGTALSAAQLSQVWSNRYNGIIGTDAISIVNEIERYNIAITAAGSVGGGSYGSNTSYISTVMTGTGNPLTISYNNVIAAVELENALDANTPKVLLARAYSTSDINPASNLQTSSFADAITTVFDKDLIATEFQLLVNGDPFFETKLLSNIDPDTGITRTSTYFGPGTLLGGTSGYTYRFTDLSNSIGYSSGLFSAQQFLLLSAYSSSPLSSIFKVTNDGVGGNPRFNVTIIVTDGNAKTIEVRYAKRISNTTTLAYAAAVSTIASAAIPPSVVRKAEFEVLSNTSIKLSWLIPLSTGGANQTAFVGATPNSGIFYRVTLLTKSSFLSPTPTGTTIAEISDTNYTFNSLLPYSGTNDGGTSYHIKIAAYYKQQNNGTKLSTSEDVFFNLLDSNSEQVAIRCAAPPTSPSLTFSLDKTVGQKATFQYIVPNQSSYPIKSIKVFANDDTSPCKIITGAGGANFLPNSTQTFTITQTDFTSSGAQSTFLNGQVTTFKFVPVVDYLYAQPVPTILQVITPTKIPDSPSLLNPSADGKNWTFSAKVHGTAALNIIAVGKIIGSNTMQVLQLTTPQTFTPFYSGSADSNDADNQLIQHPIIFTLAVSDVILFFQHNDGTLSITKPNNSLVFPATPNP